MGTRAALVIGFFATLADIALERSTAGHVVTSRSTWDRMPRGPRRIEGA